MVTMIIFVCFYLRIRIINSRDDETDLMSRNILLVTNEPSMTHSSDSGFSDPYNTFKKGDVSGGYYEQGVSSNKSLSIDN